MHQTRKDHCRRSPAARSSSRPIGRQSIALASGCLIVCLNWISSGVTHAAEWSAEPSLQFTTRYDDNIYLRREAEPIATWGATVTPSLNLSRRTARSAANANGSWIINRYSHDDIRDTDAGILRFNGNTRAKRSRINWRGLFRSTTTVTTIEEFGDLDEIEDIEETGEEELDEGIVDTNLVPVDVRRNFIVFEPSWHRALTHRTSMQLGYRINDVRFSGREETSLVDYQAHTATFGLTREFSRQTRMAAVLSAMRYEAPDANAETDDVGLRLTLNRQFSPQLRGTFGLGMHSTTIRRGGVEGEATGVIYSAGFERIQSELTSYSFDLERSVMPSGAGLVMLSDMLNASLNHEVSPLTSFSLRATAFNNTSLDPARVFADRVYYSIDAGFRRAISRLWEVEASYRYRRIKYRDADEAADSNAVLLSIRYTWPRFSASR